MAIRVEGVVGWTGEAKGHWDQDEGEKENKQGGERGMVKW